MDDLNQNPQDEQQEPDKQEIVTDSEPASAGDQVVEESQTTNPEPQEEQAQAEAEAEAKKAPTESEEKALEEAANLPEDIKETKEEIIDTDLTNNDSKTDVVEPVKSAKDAKGSKWYVVHTYSGHEAKVAATLKQKIESLKLEDKVLDILVPTQEKIEIKEGKKSKVNEKIFPGYLLIKMVLDDDTWLAVRTTQGITSFVGVANRPTPLPEEEVATIQRFMNMEAPKFKTSFSVGEAVKIVDGPFSEFLGSISEIDEEKGVLKVLVSIFGRETPVELDFLQVAKL